MHCAERFSATNLKLHIVSGRLIGRLLLRFCITIFLSISRCMICFQMRSSSCESSSLHTSTNLTLLPKLLLIYLSAVFALFAGISPVLSATDADLLVTAEADPVGNNACLVFVTSLAQTRGLSSHDPTLILASASLDTDRQVVANPLHAHAGINAGNSIVLASSIHKNATPDVSEKNTDDAVSISLDEGLITLSSNQATLDQIISVISGAATGYPITLIDIDDIRSIFCNLS